MGLYMEIINSKAEQHPKQNRGATIIMVHFHYNLTPAASCQRAVVCMQV